MNSINEPNREHLSFDLYHPQPLVVVISGPSGVGKDAVLKAMQARGLPYHFVVTMTSRPPRENEVDGVDYFFTTREHFEELIRQDEFIEWALVYEDYKGVPKSQIRQALESGKDVILRVDVQGAATFRKLCPEAVLIFLIPQDEAEWMERLKNRKTETPESLKLRLETARAELERLNEFDYVVVNANDRLDEAVDTIVDIINAEHHRVHPRRSCL
ncbi:MAG TPA: guanylate kinase [Anaerolinea thermolimosa]|uniref:Guanylate kinase n=1 Tax=Anaerolinea thermolimosa TaxID=229919 RepID=A0A3D1JF00_9CHLR|nr:guanylate kinase [Anaerolinea thermolimosa]GAP08078.1 guanylate kinase [Anaerolinea thermolimosa]HCE17092.1 guanylate kinase [Anaerolinea thermolimosa]